MQCKFSSFSSDCQKITPIIKSENSIQETGRSTGSCELPISCLENSSYLLLKIVFNLIEHS